MKSREATAVLVDEGLWGISRNLKIPFPPKCLSPAKRTLVSVPGCFGVPGTTAFLTWFVMTSLIVPGDPRCLGVAWFMLIYVDLC